MVQTDLFELVVRVDSARRAACEVRETYQTALAAFEAEHAELLTAKAEADAEVARHETALREAAVQVFAADGSTKQIATGVGIRESQQATLVDKDRAFAWAKKTGLALTLDLDALRRHAVASPGMVPGVEVKTVATATIARDLAPLVAHEKAVRGIVDPPARRPHRRRAPLVVAEVEAVEQSA